MKNIFKDRFFLFNNVPGLSYAENFTLGFGKMMLLLLPILFLLLGGIK